MELHAVQGPGLVADAHDFALGRPGGYVEVRVRPRFLFDNERVVTGRVERVRQAGEDALAVVVNGRDLAVHDSHVANDFAAKSMADALVAEADAEDGRLAREPLQDIVRHARLVRRTRAGGDDDVTGFEGGDLVRRDLIVADTLMSKPRSISPNRWTRL